MSDLKNQNGNGGDESWKKRLEELEKKAESGELTSRHYHEDEDAYEAEDDADFDYDYESEPPKEKRVKQVNQNRKKKTVSKPAFQNPLAGLGLSQNIIKLAALLGGAFIALIILIVLIVNMQKVNKKLVVEAGAKYLDAEQFLKREKDTAQFVTDISQIDLSVPGSYEIKLTVNDKAKTYKSTLVIQDTVAPTAQAVDVQIGPGGTVAPEDFVTGITDATAVTVTFNKEPDVNQVGTQEVSVSLKDDANNVTKITSTLYVGSVRNKLEVEAGSKDALAVGDFLMKATEGAVLLSDLSNVSLSTPGYFEARIQTDEGVFSCQVEVKDTMAPQASVKTDVILWQGQEVTPEDMILDYWDASSVNIYFLNGQTAIANGSEQQKFSVVLEDAYGNKSMVVCTATVQVDSEAPKIYGAEDQTVYVGDTIDYQRGIYVEDNSQAQITAVINSDNVDTATPGTYPVTYSAQDPTGNQTELTINITVIEKTENLITEAQAYAEVDRILGTIITSGMTKMGQARAIYNWCRDNLYYVGDASNDNWVEGAYYGITSLTADGYTYFAIAKAMLTRLEIDNIAIVGNGYSGTHYWNMVNLGDGWYHFDATPDYAGGDFFMVTDTFFVDYAAVYGNSHTWDANKYPATPTTDAVDSGELGKALDELQTIVIPETEAETEPVTESSEGDGITEESAAEQSEALTELESSTESETVVQ